MGRLLNIAEGALEPRRQTAFQRDGYVVTRSDTLRGEPLVVVRDEKVQLPTEFSGLPRYAVAELHLLDGRHPEEVRAVHKVRQIFGARLVGRVEPKP